MLSELHIAAKNGDRSSLNNLIKAGIDVNMPSIQGKKTALIYAVEGGHFHLLLPLLNAGADVNATDKYGQTALLCGIKKGFGNPACALLKDGADPNITDCYGKNALTCAVLNNQIEVVGQLLDAGGDANTRYRNGRSLYNQAVLWGNAKIIERLWVCGVELDLAGAAILGNVDDMETIISDGGDVNQKSGYGGRSILMGAALFGQTAATGILLDYGSDINARSFSGTALCYAAGNGHTNTVIYLLERGASIDIEDLNGTALLIAAGKGHKKTVQTLLEAGAKVGLHEAASIGDETMIEALLDAGLGINRSNTVSNKTPLICAAEQGHYSTIYLLLQRGADIKGESGRRSLKIAQRKKFTSIVGLLKDFGASESVYPPSF